MSVITGQGVTAYPLPDEELSPTSKNAVSNEAVCEGLDEIKNTLNHKADVIYDTASGDIASFPDGADGLPVKDLTVGIEPIQDLHGYANPWPAGGGKNLLPMTVANIKEVNSVGTWSGNAYTTKGMTFTLITDDGENVIGVLVNGTSTGESYFRFESPTAYPAETYIASITFSPATTDLRFRDGYSGKYNTTSSTSFTTDGSRKEEGSIYVDTGVTISNVTCHPMIRLASVTDATFAPYSNICPISGWTGCNISHSGADTSDPTVLSISWQSEAGTVYGGTLDVTSGVLTVDRVCDTYDGSSDELWTMASHPETDVTYRYYIVRRDVVQNKGISNLFTRVSFSDRGNDVVCFAVGNTETHIRNYSASLSDFKTWLSNNPVQICYELATSVTYTLDPVTMTTLLGQNNIWSDTGSSTVEYPADTKLYIDKKLAALVAALS